MRLWNGNPEKSRPRAGFAQMQRSYDYDDIYPTCLYR